MFNLFIASLYKLFREKTFLITMIIGTAMAVFLPLIYKLVDIASGQAILLASVAPGSNFGLTVPINLAVLVVAEFTTGTLRNKIIAGYRKSFIYLSLVFSGIIFTILMMVYYIGLSTLIGTLLGGFDLEAIGGAKFLTLYLVSGLLTYIFVACFSIFVASNIRAIGSSLPILIITLTVLSLIPIFISLSGQADIDVLTWVLPGYIANLFSTAGVGMILLPLARQFTENANAIAASIACPLIYSIVFVILGVVCMEKRDVK